METDEWDGRGGLIVGGRLWMEGHWWILKFGGCWVLKGGRLVISIHHPAEMATSSISRPPLKYRGGMINGGVELIRGGVEGCGLMRQSCH